MKRMHYERLINDRHLSLPLTVDQLKGLKSILLPYNGSFFSEWMECEIRKQHLNNPPLHHPTLHLKQNNTLLPSITKKLIKFCKLASCESVGIQIHHITLRSKMPSLPLLSCGKEAQGGSHLCGTLGCVLKRHVIIESEEVNQSRQSCFGVILQVHQSGSDVGCIVKIKPCLHGRKLNTSLHEQLEYSCRKIQAIISEDEHVELYK